MELERKYVTLSKQKGHAVSQVTLEEDLNVPDQKPDIFRIVHRQGEFCPDEIKGEAGKVKVRGIFHYRILYIGEGAGHMPLLNPAPSLQLSFYPPYFSCGLSNR